MEGLTELKGLLIVPPGVSRSSAWDRNLYWRNRSVETDDLSPECDLCDALAAAWEAIAGMLEAEASGRFSGG
jgi:hypothetical protein